jgi:hypothetical protein
MDEKNRSKSEGFGYSRTPEISHFIGYCLNQEGDLEGLAQRLNSNPMYDGTKERHIDLVVSDFINYRFSEMVEDYKEDFPEKTVHQLADRVESRKYLLNQDVVGKTHIYDRYTSWNGMLKKVGEFSGLIEIDGVPVILGLLYRRFPNQKEELDRSKLIGRITRKAPGYGIVTTGNVLDEFQLGSFRAKKFQEHGGYVIGLPIIGSELSSRVLEICDSFEYSFPVVDEGFSGFQNKELVTGESFFS